MKRKLTALFLVVVMCMTMSVPAFAATTDGSDSSHTTILAIGDTRIDSYKNSDGDTVLLQYVNNVITQRNTIVANSDEIITEIFENGTVRVSSLCASDYIAVTENGVSAASVNLPVGYVGTINYRALYNANYVYYGAKCSYTISKSGPTTYTFNKYTGTLVSLVTLIVSVFVVPEVVGASIAQNLLANAGITVVGGALTSALTTTVSCEMIAYTWKLVDTTKSSNISYLDGAEYYITDINSSKKGETIYEGYIPDIDWETDEFAGAVHSELFDYLMWEVVNWGDAVYV